MPIFEMHCQYCGKRWEVTIYFTPKEKNVRCIVCNDRNLKYRELSQVEKESDVFGYNIKQEEND
jgi:predicted nucleic acid-binding Zn ribbon protein